MTDMTVQSLAAGRVSVVIITRNRRESLLRTLTELEALVPTPPIIVVDNGSTDGTAGAVRTRHPRTELLCSDENLAAAGRNLGVQRVRTAYVAFADDDSWWAPGSLERAAEYLDARPTLGLVAGRIVLEPSGRTDPLCEALRASPLGTEPGMPGPSILGFAACGAVVRAEAFEQVGGFRRPFGVGGEEELLAIDLAARGWRLAYADDLIAHHAPSPARNPRARQVVVLRNAIWCLWLRRPLGVAAARTVHLLAAAARSHALVAVAMATLRGVPWVLAGRERTPMHVEVALRLIEVGEPSGGLTPISAGERAP